MKYLSAYSLLVLGGNKNPSEDDVRNLLNEVGINVDNAAVKRVVEALKGKNLDDVVKEGLKKVQNLSFGGGSGGSQAPATSAPAAGKKEEPKKKVEEKAPEPEEDVDMGGLFDF